MVSRLLTIRRGLAGVAFRRVRDGAYDLFRQTMAMIGLMTKVDNETCVNSQNTDS